MEIARQQNIRFHVICIQESWLGRTSNIFDLLGHDPYQDPNTNYNKLHDKLMKLKDKNLPIRFQKFDKHKHKGNKGITKGILKSIKYKDQLYKALKGTAQSDPSYTVRKDNLSAYKKILKKSIREAKIQYYNAEFEKSKHNIKKTWKTIADIIQISKNKPNGIKCILDNGRLTDQLEITNKFNDFFINIGPSLTKNMPTTRNHNYGKYLTGNILSSFQFDLVDDDTIVKTLHSIRSKSSSGHDGISTKLLKFLSPPLISPLRVIINQSLITGIFPEKLKIAKVIPLFKKDDKAKTDNYRPISLLSSISKIFEKVVYNQLYRYFTQNKLFYDSQYGFRAKHSTELATVEQVDRILHSIDNKELPLAIYMDLSKAFDTLDHTILSNKLRYYGITDISLKWFMSNLSQSIQYVEVNDIQSSKRIIQTGVPQGSILGPLLFLIYMNDIPSATEYSTFILYADDTTLFSTMAYSHPALSHEHNILINGELLKVNDWLVANRLSLNVNKTKYMLFHNSQKDISNFSLNLNLNHGEIEKVSTFNFLGIILDENIHWKPRIENVACKLAKYCGVLSKFKNFLPLHILRTLYYSITHPHLNYGLLIWGFQCNRIVKLQKRAIRPSPEVNTTRIHPRY